MAVVTEQRNKKVNKTQPFSDLADYETQRVLLVLFTARGPYDGMDGTTSGLEHGELERGEQVKLHCKAARG